MNQVSSPLLAAGSLASSRGTDRERLATAAQQFEAIFVRQMLAAARKTEFASELSSGQAMDTFRTMQDENFADIASKTGALGLAVQIEAQLSRQIGKEA